LSYFICIIKETSPLNNERIDSFETLKLKIDYLQSLVDTKQNDINSLKEAFAFNVRYYNNLIEKQRKLLEILKNSSLESVYKALNYTGNELSSDDEKIKSLIMKLNIDSNLTTLNAISVKNINSDVEFPQVIEYLPHLSGRSHLVQPKFKQSKSRFA
jgi:hypothetical protein